MLSEQTCWSRPARRRIVVFYYLVSLALGWFAWALFLRGPAPAGWHGFVDGFAPGALLSWLVLSPGLLGGVRAGGLVRPFSPRYGRTWYNFPLTELFLSHRRRREEDTAPVDERDREVRDHAHYLAMSVLRLGALLLAVGVWAAMILRSACLAPLATFGCYALFIAAMTLPQAILLWTEPDLAPEPLDSTVAGVSQ